LSKLEDMPDFNATADLQRALPVRAGVTGFDIALIGAGRLSLGGTYGKWN